MDRLLLPGGDGVALPHLCGQLQNSAERVYRTRAIWRRVRFPYPRDADRLDLHRVAGETKETLVMVSVTDMHQTMPQQLPPQTDRPIVENETTRVMIAVRDLDFAYGTHQVLHKVALE